MKNQPDCCELWIESVRRLRRTPANITPGAKAGTGLEGVWAAVCSVYSAAEAREALALMVKDDVVLLTARFEGGDENCADVVVKKIPLAMGNCRNWHLNSQGEYATPEQQAEAGRCWLWKLTIYVVADGLPRKAQRIAGVTCRRPMAEELIEQMVARNMRFTVGEKVQWADGRYPAHVLATMRRKYGSGPFRILGVRSYAAHTLETEQHTHAQAVTIDVGNLLRQEFSAIWFKKG